jgi:hypothetical protein
MRSSRDEGVDCHLISRWPKKKVSVQPGSSLRSLLRESGKPSQNRGRSRAGLRCRKCVTKSLTRRNQERISPLLRRGTGTSIPRVLRASGRFLTSWIERRDAWAAVRARDALDLYANASKDVCRCESSGNRYAFVFGILTLPIRCGPQGLRRVGEVNLRV